MSQENHFPSTFQSDRSWSVLNNDDDDKYRFYPSFNSEKSWSVLGSQDVDDRPFGISTYGYAAEDENSKVREYLRDQQQHRFTQLPVVERISSPPISSFPEPEFAPSLNASTKEFLENTFKYDRKSDEDFVGRPNECESDDDCSPPPPLSPPPSQFLSSNFINDGLDSDLFMTTTQSDQIHHDGYQSSQITITESSSRGNRTLVWALGLIVCIIAVIYGISDYIPNMILGYCFS